MSTSVRYMVYALFAVALTAGVFVIMAKKDHVVQFGEQGRIRVSEEKAYWTQRISAVGGPAAYAEFARAVEGLTPRQQHSAAHVFGESLFETTSLREGIGTCDARFTMGCFHALFGSAAVSLGTDSFLEEMQTACAGRARGMERLCLHGVGHGILGALGYESSDLVKALELCERIPDAGNLTTGCWGGAFMEYNVQTLISLDSPERPLSNDNMLDPCPSLPMRYRASCMFWQPTWWHVSLSRTISSEEVFSRMGSMCSKVVDPQLSAACFKGIGFRTTWTTAYNADEAAHLCSLVGGVEARLTCWRSAKNDLPKAAAQSAAYRVCEGLLTEDEESCRAASKD